MADQFDQFKVKNPVTPAPPQGGGDPFDQYKVKAAPSAPLLPGQDESGVKAEASAQAYRDSLTPSGPTSISAAPKAHPVSQWLSDALGDLEQGTSTTVVGKLADFFTGNKEHGHRPGINAVPAGQVLAGPVLGPLHVAHAAMAPVDLTLQTPEEQAQRDKETLGQTINRGLRPPLEMVQGQFQTAAPTSLLLPGGPIATGTLPTLAQMGTEKGVHALGGSPEASELSGDIAAALTGGLEGKLSGKGKVKPEIRTENLNALRPTNNARPNYPATESVMPDVVNAAAKVAQDKPTVTLPQERTPGLNPYKKFGGTNPSGELSFKGKGVKGQVEAGAKVAEAAQGALDDHETVVQHVTDPYQDRVTSTQDAADAIRSQVTPEMRAAAAKNPTVAAQVNQIDSLATELDGNHTIRDINAKRQRWNNDLAPTYDKSGQAQAEAPAVTKAKKAGVEALRDVQYETISNLSGTDIRGLKVKEGQLIDFKADVNKRLSTAANSPNNVIPPYGERVRTALTKTAGGKETSIGLAKTILGAKPETPIGKFNATAKRALSNLPQYQGPTLPELPPEVQAALTPEERTRLGLDNPDIVRPANLANSQQLTGDIPLAPRSAPPTDEEIRAADHQAIGEFFNNNPNELWANEGWINQRAQQILAQQQSGPGGVLRRPPLLLGQGDVTTPPNAAGMTEHLPNNFQSEGGVLPQGQGRVVPKQLPPAAPPGQKALPQKAGGAIGLPESSQTTIEQGRQFETPAANAEVLPSLIRGFIEKEEGQGKFQGKKVPPVGGGSKASTGGGVGESEIEQATRRAPIPPEVNLGNTYNRPDRRGFGTGVGIENTPEGKALIANYQPPQNEIAAASNLNSPEDAANFLHEAALKYFNRPFEALTDREKFSILSEATRLQNKARGNK